MKAIFSQAILRQLPLAVVGGALITLLGCKSDSVHYPFFLNMLLSVGLGWLQPRQGWVLAIVQIISIFGSYGLVVNTNVFGIENPDLARFATYLAPLPTLAGSFMGGFLKRAFLS